MSSGYVTRKTAQGFRHERLVHVRFCGSIHLCYPTALAQKRYDTILISYNTTFLCSIHLCHLAALAPKTVCTILHILVLWYFCVSVCVL